MRPATTTAIKGTLGTKSRSDQLIVVAANAKVT
jgi:hypothetical protein